ncbi:hypothetical protein UG55_100315 [Frankia sp. EI5c]|uniref:hypothetical protein n=1 Tax=Frankia sp. EI5c TaxID=683316 RepID=UPI0007C2A08A|nr:hypothetical protein [Frankia sp. EI5c]OAA29204.1 hypothetical protein UG55_100315 [Frankia sp. EI5c]
MVERWTIEVTEQTLQSLRKEYEGLLAEIGDRLATHAWSSGAPALSLRRPFPLWLGGAQFTEAVELASALGDLREQIVGRVSSTYSNTSSLYWGLEFLLTDSEAVEELSTLTAAEFEAFIPIGGAQPTGGGAGGGAGGGSGAGSGPGPGV